jgi:hypothetical protein
MMHYLPNKVRYARMHVTVLVLMCYESVKLICTPAYLKATKTLACH